jgi:predicted ATPase
MIRSIECDKFPPFGKLAIEFPVVSDRPKGLAEVHLLTGVNGTGKTRLLSVLAAALGNPEPLLRRIKSEQARFQFQIRVDGRKGVAQFHAHSGGLGWPSTNETVQWCTQVPAFAYQGAAYVCDAAVQVLAPPAQSDRKNNLSFHPPEKHSQELLQALMNLKVQAAMDSFDSEDGKTTGGASQIVRLLEQSVSKITGKPFAFQVRRFPEPALQVSWAGLTLSFNLLPDGLRSIIGWLVDAVVMVDNFLQGRSAVSDVGAIFLLDEIECNLHPVWQRRVLPAFQALFPKAQVFVATHSPFVIASLNHGWIHKLVAEGDSVQVKRVSASQGDSYITVLEDIMGLEEWYDPDTEALLAQFRELRNAALRGDASAKQKAIDLAAAIGGRSLELQYMMGRELRQLQRQA